MPKARLSQSFAGEKGKRECVMVRVNSPPVKIDIQAIPKIEVRVLCGTILEAVEAFYKDPKNAAAFEAWQKERKIQQKRPPTEGLALTGGRLSVNAEIPQSHYTGEERKKQDE